MIPEWIKALTDLDLIESIEKVDYDVSSLSRANQALSSLYNRELEEMGFLLMVEADKADLDGTPGELVGDFRSIFERLLFEVS